MATCSHLSKAPITEALIDIRVELPEATDFQALSAFPDAVRDAYPTSRDRRRGRVQLDFSQAGAPKVQAESEHPDGYLCTSADGTQVVQARLDGFTFSRLKPYQTWEQLRDTTRSLWGSYRQIARPSAVTRIAVRYINRLELPLPFEDLREWVLTVPGLPPALPQELDGFFMKLNLPFQEPSGFVNLMQSLEPGEYKTSVPLIFDIDVFLPHRCDPADDEMWERFEDLRTIKNCVFFNSITDKTKGLYE